MMRCQRIGCDATFSEDDNAEDSCVYHDSVSRRSNKNFKYANNYANKILSQPPKQLKQPIFHDGMKEWSCCKQKSHDFSLFLEIPGCKRGKHTIEKPLLADCSTRKQKPLSSPATAPAVHGLPKDTCPRCRQGFFCSGHGANVIESKPVVSLAPTSSNAVSVRTCAPAKKIIGINEPQTCKNKGCGRTFKEKDNNESACNYHPGPAVFHDRMKGWKCCDIHVKEFEEFMNIPPCSSGWHNADPVS